VTEKREKCCTWTENEDGYWETNCGNAFTLEEGTPTKNEMVFCCYCGCKLREVRFEEPCVEEA